jgi:hypothetical protein
LSKKDKQKQEIVEKLKKAFRKAQEEGEDSLKKGSKELKNNPDRSALFTLLAGNIINRSKSQK